jgi:hypothetical protein
MYVGGNISTEKNPITQNIDTLKGINTYTWNNVDGKTNTS